MQDANQKDFVQRIILAGFLIRIVLMFGIHVSGAEESMRLTKDAFLYDEVGQQIAEYYHTQGATQWPTRVTRVVDFGWEHTIGVVYYLVGHQPIAIKMICVFAGTLIPLIHYRTASIITNDSRIALLVLVLSAFFPTQVYYSTLMVRDSVAALAVSTLFLGVAEYVCRSSNYWWVYVAIGFLGMLGLRSYLASMLAVVIPISLMLTAFVSEGGRTRAVSGVVILGILLFGVITFAPELVGEVDTQFTDLNYINKVRGKMNHGSGAMFSGGVTEVGKDITDTITSFGVGLYFFFFSVNFAQIGSMRQIMALPEVFLVIFGTVFSLRGGYVLWKERRDLILPVLIPTLVLTLGYSAATTNGGPLMRWRMQLVGVYLILAATGWVCWSGKQYKS
ncbi:MAG: glycosyltransferase family 39 protein [Planctomycetota bacterium]